MTQEITIEKIYFKELKALSNVTISISPTLTAIMGVNGVGKTTVIHALACMFQPNDKGENYKFPYFFTPSSDSLWANSELILYYKLEESNVERKYSKKTERWSPRYRQRPKKDVYYIGIETCLPDIEQTTKTSRIDFKKTVRDDRISKKIIETAACILSKDYIDLTDNIYNNKSFIGVNTKSGVNYSSLSMGTGEQRIIKILRTVFLARHHSLILIDEIDLLLHVSALKKLMNVLDKISKDRHLQIVFTTHSLEIAKMEEHVLIQYIQKINCYSKMITCVYNRLTDDLMVDISGESSKPIKIYVEDSFSEAIAHYVCRKKDIVEKAEIIKIGSIENSFTLASGLILEKKDCSNMAVLLDGDKYTTDDEKEDRLKKMISGTDLNAEENRKNAKKIIIQYDSPNQLSPEEFLYSLIVDLSKENIQSDIIKMALKINSVVDKHEYINIIKKRLELSDREIVNDIAILLTNCEKWNKYICPLEEWLEQRRDL